MLNVLNSQLRRRALIVEQVQPQIDAAAERAPAITAASVAAVAEETAEWVEAKVQELPDEELAGKIADWLEVGGHSRPFFRDRDFVAEFGAVRRVDLYAAAPELKRRAEAKASAIGAPPSWPSMPLQIEGEQILFDGQPIAVPEVAHVD